MDSHRCWCGFQPPARCQRGTSDSHKNTPTDYLLFFLLVPVAVGRVARLCLSQTLPLCPLVCSASLFLGQMTHSIIVGFILEVQWLDSTQKLCEKAYMLGIGVVWANWPAWWRSSSSQVLLDRGRLKRRAWCQRGAQIYWKNAGFHLFTSLCVFSQDICKSLWCHRTGHRCETKFMPAAEGTSCGPDMVRSRLASNLYQCIDYHVCFY